MSRMTTTERQLMKLRRERSGRPLFLPSARISGYESGNDMDLLYFFSVCGQVVGTVVGIVMLCHLMIVFGIAAIVGIPLLYGIVGSIFWIVRYRKQTNTLCRSYIGTADYRWNQLASRSDFTAVYDKVKYCEPTPMTAQLAELCGQVTVRSLSMPPIENIADEDKQAFTTWFTDRYDEASRLADAIVEYDAEMKQAEVDSAVRADRITANTLVKGLEAEAKVRKELSAQGIDPVGAATQTLKDLTEKSRQVRKACNEELKKLSA